MEVGEEGDYIPSATLSHHQNDSWAAMRAISVKRFINGI